MRSSTAFCAVVLLLSACGEISPSSLEFVEVVPATPRIGEVVTVRFRAIDSRGLPMAGASVNFSLESQNPSVRLDPTEATTNKGDGIASTQLIATSRVTSVVVIAQSGDKTVLSPPISFAGSSASHRQFTFQCGEIGSDSSGGIHALGAFDESRHLIAGLKLDCIAHVGDRNGDGVSGALVSFLTEAGTINPTGTSVADVAGNAKVLYKSSYPLPKDVDPGTFTFTPANDAVHTGALLAPMWMHPFLWVANPVTQYGAPPSLQEPRRSDPIRPGVTLNPRDNLVTMIAVTTGEEAFDDVNNNGVHDEGEPFEDLTEPFVDANDNGTWDLDERYIDTNVNGTWDGKNGTFDASTLIWIQERILWTGIPHQRDLEDPVSPVFKLLLPTTPPAIGHFGSAAGMILLADPWFNSPAQNSDSDACSLSGSKLVVGSPEKFNGPGVATTYPSFRVVSFNITDVHDPIDPETPSYAAPLNFTTSVGCTFTASPLDSFTWGISVGAISGTVL